jgi:hypothetical protein
MGARTDLASSIIKDDFKLRFLMDKMTLIPVVGGAVEFAFFDRDKMAYLPKDSVVTTPRARTIDVGKEVIPRNIVMPSKIIEQFLQRNTSRG